MSKSNQRAATIFTAKTIDQIQKPGRGDNARAPVRTEPSLPTAEKNAAPVPLQAAKGDDDLMSKQQNQHMPGVDELQGEPKQQAEGVEYAWDDLTEDEVLKSKDHRQKRSGHVRGRYAFTRGDADKDFKNLLG